MAVSSDTFGVLHRLGIALNSGNFPSFCLKPLQVKCFDNILKGYDVVAAVDSCFDGCLDDGESSTQRFTEYGCSVPSCIY